MAKRKQRRRRIRLGGLGAVSKQDFVAVAKILCRNSASTSLAVDFANYFGGQNPRFDQNRFVAAATCKV